MLRLEDLPPEIRLRIYDFVFQDTLVHPNPIMWAKQSACKDKAKFEKLQAEWPDPVGLLMTSKFFNTDPLTVRSFYTNAIFCFGVSWQWPAFVSLTRQKAGNAINPARLITSIMDTTPLFSLQTHLDVDQVSVSTLPSLKHIYLNHFSVANDCRGRIISRVYGYESHDQFNCDECTSNYRELSYEPRERRCYCAKHRAPDPSRFALQHPDTLVGRLCEHESITCCPPSDFILSSFFNHCCSLHPYHQGSGFVRKMTSGHDLKQRIMKDLVTIHLSWEMVFDRDSYGENDIRVVSYYVLN